jgi:hypothetical protein|tara:strand:- start:795 stop:1025 length:231 start_codon:yes stop_codon:yes gene_type:complete
MNVQAIRPSPGPAPVMEIVLKKTVKQSVPVMRRHRGPVLIVRATPNLPVLDTVHVHQMPLVIVTIGLNQRTSIGLE